VTRLLQAIQFKVLGFTLGEKKRRAPRARTGKRAETCEEPSEEPRKRAGTTSWRTPPEQTSGPRSDTRHLITPPLRSPGPKRSGSKYDGASAPAGSKATRKLTSRPSRPPTNRTPVVWNGNATWTAVEGRAHHLLPHPHQPQLLRGQVGRRQQVGHARHNLPEQATANTGLATSKSRTRPWLKRTVSSLRGSTNSRRAAASRDNSFTGPRESQTPSAGGASTRPKHESICPAVEKPAEDSVGGGQRRNRLGRRPVQDLGARHRREMQQGDPRLPSNKGSRTDSGPTGGGQGTRQRGLGVGKVRTRGIPCTGGGGREGAVRKIRVRGDYRLSFFLFFLFISYVKHRKAESGGRGGHIMTGTLGGSVVAGKRVL